MKVDEKTVNKVAQVARIELTDKEVSSFSRDLSEVLSAFKTLQKIPTKGVKPTFQPIEAENVLRDDKVEPSIARDKLLRNLKNKKDGYIKVPSGVEKIMLRIKRLR